MSNQIYRDRLLVVVTGFDIFEPHRLISIYKILCNKLKGARQSAYVVSPSSEVIQILQQDNVQTNTRSVQCISIA